MMSLSEADFHPLENLVFPKYNYSPSDNERNINAEWESSRSDLHQIEPSD